MSAFIDVPQFGQKLMFCSAIPPHAEHVLEVGTRLVAVSGPFLVTTSVTAADMIPAAIRPRIVGRSISPRVRTIWDNVVELLGRPATVRILLEYIG